MNLGDGIPVVAFKTSFLMTTISSLVPPKLMNPVRFLCLQLDFNFAKTFTITGKAMGDGDGVELLSTTQS